MLVGRINKQPGPAISRFTVNFAEYLDSGETIASVTRQTIQEVASGYQGPWPPNAYYQNPPQLPYDNPDTTLEFVGTYVILDNSMVQMFVTGGNVGIVYQVQFLMTGTSTRALPVEVLVQIQPPTVGPTTG
jgi:hypothetical protein